MATTRLRLYQDTARILADARLATTTDDVEFRYAVDDAFAGATLFVFNQANWRFALKRAKLVVNSSLAIPGYGGGYQYPLDYIRTHKLFVVTDDGRECPTDLRETPTGIVSNTGELWIDYVSSAYTDPDVTTWPEPFVEVFAAYLAFMVAERVTGERGAAGRMSQLFSQLLAEAERLLALPDDPWLPFQRNGEMLLGARMLLREAFWRFALDDVTILTASTSLVRGFDNSFLRPPDHLQTYRLFLSPAPGVERPFDVREATRYWSANVDRFYARYISSTLGLDSTRWDEPFRAALLAYLQAGRPEIPAKDQQQGEVPGWFQALLLARETSAEPPDPWLSHQLSGRYEHAKRFVLQQGFWTYRGFDGAMRGLKEIEYVAEADQLATDPAHGFPYRYDLPDDWMRTHALFVPWDGYETPINIRESADDWSTDAETFVARYQSTDVLDEQHWPEAILDAVYAYCEWRAAPPDQVGARGEAYMVQLAAAKAEYHREANEWLKFQINGAFRPALFKLLETGRWRFAIRTVVLNESTDPLPSQLSDGDAASSYAYRFIRPNDHLRTVRIYTEHGPEPYVSRYDIDYFNEGDAYHANMSPITVRYVSRLGLDPTKWSMHFRDALLAWLQYEDARNDPARTQIASAKLAMFKDAEREAERLDDARDRPRVIRPSLFTRARFGGRIQDRTDYVPTYIGPPAVVP